jgi:hypothetical protein
MHLRSTRFSGLRRTLAALLLEELQLLPGVTATKGLKFSLSEPYESRLTQWMLSNLTVTWVVHHDPASIEAEIIRELVPPLNGTFAHSGPYWSHTAQLRSDTHAAALARRNDQLESEIASHAE